MKALYVFITALTVTFSFKIVTESNRLPFDTGLISKEPFSLMVAGQSNADGSSELLATL